MKKKCLKVGKHNCPSCKHKGQEGIGSGKYQRSWCVHCKKILVDTFPKKGKMRKKEKWEKELLELYRNRTTAWVDGNTMHDFIAKVRQEAVEEVIEDIKDKNTLFVESCEPHCDAVRHARHEGSWKHYVDMENYLLTLKEEK